ncbi:NAD(P)-dependent oxidoreductase [Phenylobacterium immobile]|uniref:NAD(P)-dependent oxidoreductase n=1 Tax=Phenylobacterium immobile TaxID=21 RepID=UPI000A6B7E8B|nr:NAD(P)-dependent oxidoreductase [Phenylobacterium immobile]
MKTAFVGLGVMGFPMAGHLTRAGHEVGVFNRSPEKARRWSELFGGRACSTLAEAAADVELLALCVGDDDDVRAVVEATLEALAPGAVIVDHTTTSASVAREMAERAAATGRFFIDAPVSGGQAGAESGQLSIMCGGPNEAFVRVVSVIGAYAKSVKLMGGSGSGQLTKMANQICIAGIVQGLSESLHFVRRSGLDPEAVLEAISKGAAQSWQMENRWGTMAQGQFNFGFAVDWMLKDLGLVLDEAARNGSNLEMTSLIRDFYVDVRGMGGGRWDTSSLVARLEKPSDA